MNPQNIKAPRWTFGQELKLMALWKERLPIRTIAEQLGASRGAVLGKAYRLGLDSMHGFRRQPPKRVTPADRRKTGREINHTSLSADAPAIPETTAEVHWRMEAIKASVYHLIDLKRAGYSPTMTELRPNSEDRPYRAPIRAYSLGSLTGSPAGMCAAEA